MKDTFHYTSEQVITHNFFVSIIQFGLALFIRCYLSGIIHPLKILKGFLFTFSLFIITCPYLLNNLSSPTELFIIQTILAVIGLGDVPAIPIFFKYFPVFKRFTYSSFLYALSRALIHVATSFGMVYLVKYFGHWGILFIAIPISIGYGFGLFHFEQLEKKNQSYF